jgi:hypothetical protein
VREVILWALIFLVSSYSLAAHDTGCAILATLNSELTILPEFKTHERPNIYRLSADEINSITVKVDSTGQLVWNANEKSVDLDLSTAAVLNDGRLVIVNKALARTARLQGMQIYHSSFGESIKMSFNIEVRNGVPTYITNKSGHYEPTIADLRNFLLSLKTIGLPVDQIKVGVHTGLHLADERFSDYISDTIDIPVEKFFQVTAKSEASPIGLLKIIEHLITQAGESKDRFKYYIFKQLVGGSLDLSDQKELALAMNADPKLRQTFKDMALGFAEGYERLKPLTQSPSFKDHLAKPSH